jgi:hypothetical protein
MTMQDNRTVSLTISLPKLARTLLRQMAAEFMMANPDQTMTAATIVRTITEEYLDKVAQETRQESFGGKGGTGT